MSNTGEFVIENGILLKYNGDSKEVLIPNEVAEIGNSAFKDCRNLKSITIPKNVTKIGEVAFKNCEKLTSVIIPNGVTEIGDWAFDCCINLTDITIPESVVKIGDLAFAACKNLTNITIPYGVTEISDFAFSFCDRLVNITIPKSVTKIGNCAFKDCVNLTSITIPEGVTKIGDAAFAGCNRLIGVTIPESVTEIGTDAFTGNKVIIYTSKGSYAEQYANENSIDIYYKKTEGCYIDTSIPIVKDILSVTYREYSHKNVRFKLPAELFDYHGIVSETDEIEYYGKDLPGSICCDVIISACGPELSYHYNAYKKCLEDSTFYHTMRNQILPNDLVVNKGIGPVVETIINYRTISLWVKAGVFNYFRLTVSRSYDLCVTMSELRDIAYEILSTVTIDYDDKNFKRTTVKQEIVERTAAPAQPREENTNTESQEDCHIATANYNHSNSLYEECSEDAKCEAEEEQIADEKRNKIIAVAVSACCAVVIFIILLTTVIMPNFHYNNGIKFLASNNYEEAIKSFTSAGNFKDAKEQLASTYYTKGELHLEKGEYTEAYLSFKPIYTYKDTKEKLDDFIVAYDKEACTADDGIRVWTDEYTYDNQGNMIKRASVSPYDYDSSYDNPSIFEYAYDNQGNVIKEVWGDSDSKYTTKYTYDKYGNQIRSVHKDIDGKVFSWVSKHTYDNDGKVVRTVDIRSDGLLRYDTEYIYDGYGNLIMEERTSGDITIHSYKYTYDNYGNIVKEVRFDTIGAGVGVDGREETYIYTYDDCGNMIQEVRIDDDGDKWTEKYTYDDYGNKLTGEDFGPDGKKISTYKYTYEGIKIFYRPNKMSK